MRIRAAFTLLPAIAVAVSAGIACASASVELNGRFVFSHSLECPTVRFDDNVITIGSFAFLPGLGFRGGQTVDVTDDTAFDVAITAADLLAPTDAVSLAVDIPVTGDAVTTSDAIDGYAYGRPLDDTLPTPTDSAPVFAIGASLSQLVVVSEARSLAVQRTLADTATVADIFGFNWTYDEADAVTVASSMFLSPGKRLTESTPVTDAIARFDYGDVLSTTVTAADTVAKDFVREPFAHTVTVADTNRFGFGPVFTDATGGLSETLVYDVTQTFPDTVTVADALANALTLAPFADSVTTGDSLITYDWYYFDDDTSTTEPIVIDNDPLPPIFIPLPPTPLADQIDYFAVGKLFFNTVAPIDNAVYVATFERTPSDTTALVDADVKDFVREPFTDTVTPADATDISVALFPTSDVTPADAFAASFATAFAHTVAPTDNFDRTWTILRTFGDVCCTLDAVDALSSFSIVKQVSELMSTPTDNAVLVFDAQRVFAHTTTASDVTTFAPGAALTDTLAPTDAAPVLAPGKVLSHSVAPTDAAPVFSAGATLTDLLPTPTDAAPVFAVATVATDTVAPTDAAPALQFNALRTFAHATTATDTTPVLAPGKVLAHTVSPTDAAPVLLFNAARTFAHTVTVVDAVNRFDITDVLADTLAPTDAAPVFSMQDVLSDSVTMAQVFSRVWNAFLTIGDACCTVDALDAVSQFAVMKGFTELLTPTDSAPVLTWAALRTVADTVAATDATPVYAAGKVLAHTVSATDAVPVFAGSKPLAHAVSATDSTPVLAGSKQFAHTVASTDAAPRFAGSKVFSTSLSAPTDSAPVFSIGDVLADTASVVDVANVSLVGGGYEINTRPINGAMLAGVPAVDGPSTNGVINGAAFNNRTIGTGI